MQCTGVSQQEENKNESEFYEKAKEYWSTVPSTVNGMLGGLGYISEIDIQGSSTFLQELGLKSNKYALDCGAGIGRITKNLLMPRFATVDLVEQDPTFAAKAQKYCSTDAGATLSYPNRFGEMFNTGLHHFSPVENRYDLIWCQWVLGHLTDEDLIAFFKRIRKGLVPKGFFIIKENVTSSKTTEKDETDSSVTRPLTSYETFLQLAGLRVVKIRRQQNFPKGLYPVYMIACQASNQ